MAAKNSGGGTHDENGWYAITLDATDTNTVGRLQVSCKVAGALAVFMEFQVLEEAIYDALFASSAAGFDSNQRVDVGSWLGTAVTLSGTTSKPQVDVDSIDDDATAADNLEADYDGTGYNKSNSTVGTASNLTTNNDKTGYRLSATGVDDILDEAITEPSGVFAWGSATLRNIVGWLGALSRNKMTQTSSTQTLRNDDDDADIASSTVSRSGGTVTRGEFQ